MASLLSHTQGIPLSVVTSERIVVYGEIFVDRFFSHLLASCDLVRFDSPRHGYGGGLTKPAKVLIITCSCLETAI
jgi:hypothetical protein